MNAARTYLFGAPGGPPTAYPPPGDWLGCSAQSPSVSPGAIPRRAVVSRKANDHAVKRNWGRR
eukprot:1106258-Pyramimonas_sp.AAC.1